MPQPHSEEKPVGRVSPTRMAQVTWRYADLPARGVAGPTRRISTWCVSWRCDRPTKRQRVRGVRRGLASLAHLGNRAATSSRSAGPGAAPSTFGTEQLHLHLTIGHSAVDGSLDPCDASSSTRRDPPRRLASIRKDTVMACACESDRGKGNKCAHCKEGNHKACSSFGTCS